MRIWSSGETPAAIGSTRGSPPNSPSPGRHKPNTRPEFIYPNPENPARYIVVNSGFTFRESANTSNAKQLPRLPDWAIVDTATPADENWPGRIVDAGFFSELWSKP